MKQRRLVMGGIVVVILVLIGFLVWQRTTSAATATTTVQTTAVKRGSLVATVSAAGNISAPRSVALAFSSSGRIAKMNVKVGDAVQKDQILAELDAADLALSLKTAQTNLASAQTSYDQTKADLQFALRTAQSNLVSAKASLDAAKAENAQNPNSLIIAKAALDTAQVNLDKAQADYNVIAWRPDIGMTSQSQALQSASLAYESALATYNKTTAGINDSALKQAEAAYSNAQVALEQAQKNLDTKLASAQATLDNAKVAVEQAQRNLDNAKIVAPFDGAVSAVNFSVGDSVSGTVVTVVDLAQLQVKVTVAEVDIAKIQVGETAQMTMDALSGKTYTAKVISISPVGTVTSGVVNYSVVLEIENSDGAIKPGMTATLAIEVDRRDNVLLIPLRAIKTQGNQKMVSVQSNGQTTRKLVNIGLSNETYAEVTSGLQEGDSVVINQTTTSSSSNVGGMGIMNLGGGAGGPPPN